MTTPEKKGIPTWAWVGFGCLGAVVAIVLVVVGLGVWGVNQMREYGESMADPETRTETALDVLGADELPEGYHAFMALSIPFVFDMALLSDGPVPEEGGTSKFGDHGFIYVSIPDMGDGDAQLYDFFEGRNDDIGVLDDQDVELDLRERLANGRLERVGDRVLWVGHRGSVDPEEFEGSHDGLVTLMLFECDDDERTRIGIWFGPDPVPGQAPDDYDATGTVVDPDALTVFLSPMSPCP